MRFIHPSFFFMRDLGVGFFFSRCVIVFFTHASRVNTDISSFAFSVVSFFLTSYEPQSGFNLFFPVFL